MRAAIPPQTPPLLRLAAVRQLPVPEPDDAELARAMLEGRPAAASLAWDRFSPLVRGLLLRALGPGGEVEDHVQETFLRLFRQVGTLRDPAALRGFAVGITMRVARSELRRRRVHRWLGLTETGVLPDTEAQGEDPETREALVRLYTVLDRLDDEGRLAFTLRYAEGLPLAEVAAALGLSLATTKRRLTRAAARISAMVAGDAVLAAYAASTGGAP